MGTTRRSSLPSYSSALALACCAGVMPFFACTDSPIQPPAVDDARADDKLALSGRVCTRPPDSSGFPVKVVFVVDQSGSMCISDPPGSQESPGFCEAHQTVPPGVTQPARVRALNQLVAQFQSQPNVQVAVVPFETNVKGVWPANTGSGASRFARPDDTLTQRINTLQAELGKGTDYQGAMAYAYSVVASDILAVERTMPEQLPRTRYVVVFLTDGTPYPRCSANDGLSPEEYAGPDRPEGLWADSSSAVDFCNLVNSTDAIEGMPPGSDRNQNYQIFNYAKQLMELKDQYNIGDIRLHTVLLFNEEAVRACGPICQDVYGTYPGVPQAEYPQAAKKIARYVLGELARRGNGVFQEFNNSDITQLSLGALDYSSLASRNVMKSMILQSLSSEPGPAGRVVDSDGDGLPDDRDNDFTFATNRYYPDTDDDGFDDNFEARWRDTGFVPAQDDGRGCNPASPLTLNCRVSDTDGDGLSQYAEDYLKTRQTLVDSDGDGVPDGLEVRYGLNPIARTAGALDTDGDGVNDAAELRLGSSPVESDRAFQERYGYQYDVSSEVQSNGSVCYDFTVSNLQLVTPPNRAGVRQGFNLFKLWFGEAPESGVATDYGVWRSACAWAQFDPPSVREPVGPQLGPMENASFLSPQAMRISADYETRCIGISPSEDAVRR